jgi:hypothetical protein
MVDRTNRGCFAKGHSGNPGGRSKKTNVVVTEYIVDAAGRPKDPLDLTAAFAPDLTAAADRRVIRNVVVEARRFAGLAIDTLVELTKETHADSTRYSAAAALLDRGYGRPAQSLDLHLSADAITKRLSDMSDAELAALE